MEEVVSEEEEEESETQPLAWPEASEGEETQPLPWAEEEAVPPSDPEEELLAQHPVISSSSSSRSPSPTPKRRRVSPDPQLMTTTLTPNFRTLLSSLQKHERRQHNGMQRSLDAFLTRPASSAMQHPQEEEDRSGLCDDLEDVLSDDQDAGEETQPLAWSSPPEKRGMSRSSSGVSSTSGLSLLPGPESVFLQEADEGVRSFFDRL